MSNRDVYLGAPGISFRLFLVRRVRVPIISAITEPCCEAISYLALRYAFHISDSFIKYPAQDNLKYVSSTPPDYLPNLFINALSDVISAIVDLHPILKEYAVR